MIWQEKQESFGSNPLNTGKQLTTSDSLCSYHICLPGRTHVLPSKCIQEMTGDRLLCVMDATNSVMANQTGDAFARVPVRSHNGELSTLPQKLHVRKRT